MSAESPNSISRFYCQSLSAEQGQDLNHDGTVTSDERERAREMHEADLPTPADEPGNKAPIAR